jgi:hypothetical protein
MYISLYTAKQLRKMRDRMLWLGLFMGSGGAASMLYNMLLTEQTRWYWALAALLTMAVGLVLITVGTDKVKLKIAYFSVSPSLISYRLNFYSPEHVLDWRQISAVQLSDDCVLFNLYDGRQKVLRFSSFQNINMADRVRVGIQVMALEREVALQGVRFNIPPV